MEYLVYNLPLLSGFISIFFLLLVSTIIKDNVSASAGKKIWWFAGLWLVSFAVPLFGLGVPATFMGLIGVSFIIRGISYLILLYAFILIGLRCKGMHRYTLIVPALIWFASQLMRAYLRVMPYEQQKVLGSNIVDIGHGFRIVSSLTLLVASLVIVKIAFFGGETTESPNKAL